MRLARLDKLDLVAFSIENRGLIAAKMDENIRRTNVCTLSSGNQHYSLWYEQHPAVSLVFVFSALAACQLITKERFSKSSFGFRGHEQEVQ